eukprot:scaffold44096_cov82-Cyclotella_meneghiniana.AAC.1
MLCGLDWNALPARDSTGWILSAGRQGTPPPGFLSQWEVEKFSCCPYTEKVQVSVCGELFIQTIAAAGLSQCLIQSARDSMGWILTASRKMMYQKAFPFSSATHPYASLRRPIPLHRSD